MMKKKSTPLLLALLATAPFFASCGPKDVAPEVNSFVPATSATKHVPATPDYAAHPFLDPSLNIAWSRLTPDKIVPDMRIALARARANIEAIASLPTDDPSALTYENTVGALWDNAAEFDFVWGKVTHLENVKMSDAFREAYAEILPEVSEYETKTGLNPRLWNVIKAYAETDEAKNLPPQKARYLKKVVDGFRDGGADLPPEQKKELTEISRELTTITQEFSQNVLDATNAYRKVVTDEALLAGLPASDKAAALEAAKKAGLATDEKPAWLFTLQQTSFGPALKYLENEALRTESLRHQYESLKSQLNPHMLFNSLNTLQSLIRESPPKALDYTQELSQVLRYTLRDNDRQSVTLAEEMQFARAYIYLMKMRYEENLVFRIAIDERMNGLLLPPMSVQLLIENAIKHNEISNRNPLTITIRTEQEALLVCNPIQPKRVAPAGPGIGLDNLAKRYRLLWQDEIGITADKGMFCVRLPLHQPESEKAS